MKKLTKSQMATVTAVLDVITAVLSVTYAVKMRAAK